MGKIFVVEDDVKLRNLIKDSLERYGYAILAAEDFLSLEEEFKKELPELVLLDINLPYNDGFYYCRAFRRISKAPIIMISARNGDMEQVMSMELGADDYIIKPFNIDILIAKVKSVFRRVYGEYSNAEEKDLEVLGMRLKEKSFKIEYKGMQLELSKNEFKLVKKFLEKKDMVVSREELLSELWDEFNFVDDNTLTVNVTRIKNRLSELGIRGAIKTKRGIGYIFDTSALEAGRDE
ncbi:response regulator transcription factor [Clostridium sp. 19966]|uniref:response regulator transcription factor n=1 Tax=Clostridium sp. 19966 TaxID=2768166 RepID=UPI0028DDD402|nr:response regulator transcription factor [Clostridium sp. 19966]MDT8716851.1 response regulator transcription factor [Clostridium sp. 19966]